MPQSPTTRPVTYRRLHRLVRGLANRSTVYRQDLHVRARELQQRETQVQQQLDAALQRLSAQADAQEDAWINRWDEAVQATWDAAELQTYKAIYDTQQHEDRLKSDARSGIEEIRHKAQQRVAQVEQSFAEAKAAAAQRQKDVTKQLSQLRQRIDAALQRIALAFTQNSLRMPAGQPPQEELGDCPGDLPACLEEAQRSVEQAEQVSERLTRNPLARFFGSAWWWGTCGLLFIGLALGLVLGGQQPILVAVAIAAASTIAFLVFGVLGIRPMMRRMMHRECNVYFAAHANWERQARRAEELNKQRTAQEIQRHAQKRERRIQRARQWEQEQIEKIKSELERDIQQLQEFSRAQKMAAAERLSSGLQQHELEFQTRLEEEQTRLQQAREAAQRQAEQELEASRRHFAEFQQLLQSRSATGIRKAIDLVQRHEQWCSQHFPPFSRMVGENGDWPEPVQEPAVPLGRVQLAEVVGQDLLSQMDSPDLAATLLYFPIHDGPLVVQAEQDDASLSLVRQMILRALTGWGCGRVQVCVMDPHGLGRDFGWLMHLGDVDPQLVYNRVWTQGVHISRKLEELSRQAEDFIQQSLRDQYEHIAQYNRDAGSLAEPYRILLWRGFPAGLQDDAVRNLISLIKSGPKCGIFPLLCLDATSNASLPPDIAQALEGCIRLTCGAPGADCKLSTAAGDVVLPCVPQAEVDDSVAQQIVQEVGRRSRLAARVEVPLTQMLPSDDAWQTADASTHLEIPLGQSGVGRVHSIRLGIGTAQHAIIAGKTGSGKSSLLHAMITSAIARYGPGDLRLVLLDFKKGVEFQVYAERQLPHADIIGIESHREFGLSALQYVNDCLHRRGAMFRAAGVQDIATWNTLHPEQKLPRVLVIVDEFQELFCADDRIASEAELALDRIVRQGRSFGVHAVLSSQTLAGSYSLPRTTLGQMAVRIALQCDPADAQIIFDEDNPAAARLKHPGQAIYNDAGGRIEGNQPMQIGWLPKTTQVELLERAGRGYRNEDPTTNLLGKTIVFDGSKPALWNAAAAEQAITHAAQTVNSDAIWCVAGESVAIQPAVTIPLTYQAGRNVLLVGNDDAAMAATLSAIIASLAHHASGHQRPFVCRMIQGARPTDRHARELPRMWAAAQMAPQVVEPRDAEKLIDQVYEELLRREERDASPADEPLQVLLVAQLGRVKALRRPDDYDFGDLGDGPLSPAKKLEKILAAGPSHGMFTLLWADTYGTVQRWLSRSTLKELEIRILGQMGAADASNLVESLVGTQLGPHEMLLYDEALAQQQRFRPYDIASMTQLGRWIQAAARASGPMAST